MAGIPVLHRDYAHSLAIVSGHRCSSDDIALWTTWLNQSGTLVILMGMANLPDIATALQHNGVPQQMTVAVTMAGTHREEQTVLGTLADIADVARQLSAPAVIVIGHVVAYKRVCEQWGDGMEPQTLPALVSLS
jgi:uroporphyrin-III C-methyltransferase